MRQQIATALAMGALVMPPAYGQSQPTVSWDLPVVNAAQVKVYGHRGTSPLVAPPDGKDLLAITDATNSSIKLPKLDFDKWTIAATGVNGNLESPLSNQVTLLALAAPKNLHLESGTNYAYPLKLVWDKSESSTSFGDVKYRVYRRNRFPDTSTWRIITDTFSTFYSAQVLQAGQFVYRVTTLKGSAESEVSSNDINVRVGLAARSE